MSHLRINTINQSVTGPKRRSAKAFRNARERTSYWVILIALLLLGGLFAAGLLLYNNPVPVDSPSLIPVTKRRMVAVTDRKSTRLNSSHVSISYAVCCLKKNRCVIS